MTVTVSRENTIGQILKHIFYLCTTCKLDVMQVKLPYDCSEGPTLIRDQS